MKRVDGFTGIGRLKPVGRDMYETTTNFAAIQVDDEAAYVDFSRLGREMLAIMEEKR